MQLQLWFSLSLLRSTGLITALSHWDLRGFLIANRHRRVNALAGVQQLPHRGCILGSQCGGLQFQSLSLVKSYELRDVEVV